MGKLKYLTTYLAGPIDRCDDLGTGWRDFVGDELEARFGVIVLNPRKKEEFLEGGLETKETVAALHQLKLSGQFDELSRRFKQIRNYDLRMVDKSDFLIVHLDTTIYTCGTIEELTIANLQKKPILIHCTQGKKAVPNWLYGMLPHEYFYEQWDNLFDELTQIDSGQKTTKRWVHFDFSKILSRLT